MTFPPYKSSNGHTVTMYGRLFVIVTSASRKNHRHFVDLEPFEDELTGKVWRSVCNCESWRYGTRPCRHCVAAYEAIAFWAGVPEDIRDEWVERVAFLSGMGYGFDESLATDYLKELMKSRSKPKESKPKRTYQLTDRKRKAVAA